MIVVIGEALIDLIGDKENKDSFEAVVGGANANVAIALARRGAKQQFLARISTDGFGNVIKDRLAKNGVGLDHAIRTSDPTTLAIATIGESGSASYSFYVNGTADWGWTKDELPSDVDLENMHAKALQFGCLTMAMPPGNLVIEAWAKEHFAQDSITISHDINVRPALGFDRETERPRVERLNEISHIIKASDDDIQWLYSLAPGSDLDGVVQGWIGNSDKIVFLTRGGEGVRVYRRGSKFDVPARKVVVQDTVGAGDTFCANLLGQLLDLDALGDNPYDRLANLSDDVIFEIAKVAGVAASIACERKGAEPPTLSELEKVLAS